MQDEKADDDPALAAYKAEHQQLLHIFAANFAQLRDETGMSQEAFADKARLHRTNIGFYEQAKREPTLTTLLVLADALDVSLDRLAQGMPVPQERRPKRGRKKADGSSPEETPQIRSPPVEPAP